MARTVDCKDEYLDASENMRQFGNIRFAQMTLFVAITAGILSVLFENRPSLTSLAETTLKIGGILFTLVFWLLDQRAMSYWGHFRKRAIDLEKSLGFFSTY